VRKQAKELSQKSSTRTQIVKSEAAIPMSSQSGFDEIHKRIQSKLDELHADFGQLETDLRTADQASLRARKDRIEGFKRALRDLLEAANRADREWH
jgi:hypothetical protein